MCSLVREKRRPRDEDATLRLAPRTTPGCAHSTPCPPTGSDGQWAAMPRARLGKPQGRGRVERVAPACGGASAQSGGRRRLAPRAARTQEPGQAQRCQGGADLIREKQPCDRGSAPRPTQRGAALGLGAQGHPTPGLRCSLTPLPAPPVHFGPFAKAGDRTRLPELWWVRWGGGSATPRLLP